MTVCSIHWTTRKGIIQIYLGAVELREEGDNPRSWKYVCEFPSASVATFEATLFQAYNRLYKVIDDAIGHPGGRA